MEISTCDFGNVGYLKVDVPDAIMEVLNQEAMEIQRDFSKATSRNKNLAGHMDHQYKLFKSNDVLKPFVLEMTMKFNEYYNNMVEWNYCTHNIPMTVESAWINFQRKHEFNPVHNHKGLMSFVIYLQIPYDLEQEFKQGPGRLGEEPINSCFQFLFTNSLGQIVTHRIDIDKTFEGKMILFPAKMPHVVYPFYTSDDFRISVAGNVLLDTGQV